MAHNFPSDNLFLNIARGLVRGTTFNHKFGAVPAMSTNTTGTVWDVNDTVYPWSAWATAGTITIDRANTGDANKEVTVVGLDANYESLTETITLTNPTGNASTASFIRVFRAFITDGVTNAGLISIKRSTTTVAAITAGKGQTLMAVYTIPAGYTGYLVKGTCSAQAGADATGDMFIRYFGSVSFRVGHSFEVSGAGGQYLYEFPVPIPIPAKSDIDVRVVTRSNNGRYTAAFDLILIQDKLGTTPNGQII
jgi:hypothetical protein